MRKPLIAGNWKMYKTCSEAADFISEFKKSYVQSDIQVALCVPYTQLWKMKELLQGTEIKLAAQNVHYEEEGAFTGEVSPSMLKEIGVTYCIIGHSERRQYYNETDETVNKKILKAFQHHIIPIFCVGELLEARESSKEFDVIKKQVSEGLKNVTNSDVEKIIVAYEPVWAIGTGKTATPEQANEMIGFIRSIIAELYNQEIADEVIIQYGGSVKPNNATELMNMPEIDGALVGGASLNASDFIEIVNF